jgi:hypothetical protein
MPTHGCPAPPVEKRRAGALVKSGKAVALAILLLSGCALDPSEPQPSPAKKHSGWYEVRHEPRGRPYCIQQSGGVEDDRFFRCITGWRERLWVEDFDKLPQGAARAAE